MTTTRSLVAIALVLVIAAVYGPSARVVAAWEAHVRNFAPNLGNDYGGRLVAAWLDR